MKSLSEPYLNPLGVNGAIELLSSTTAILRQSQTKSLSHFEELSMSVWASKLFFARQHKQAILEGCVNAQNFM